MGEATGCLSGFLRVCGSIISNLLCLKGRFFGCMNIDTFTMIFAVINAVLWAIVLLVQITLLVMINVAAPSDHSVQGLLFNTSGGKEAVVIINVINGALALFCLLHFFFAVLLCDALNKKKAHQVKAYFIYGLVMTIIGFITMAIIAQVGGGRSANPLFLVLGPYCLFLHMVHMSYRRLRNVSNGGVVISTPAVPYVTLRPMSDASLLISSDAV